LRWGDQWGDARFSWTGGPRPGDKRRAHAGDHDLLGAEVQRGAARAMVVVRSADRHDRHDLHRTVLRVGRDRPVRQPAAAPTNLSVTDVLRVEDLAVYYLSPNGPIKAVDGVSFALKAGERLGLIGESGSGKTTMGTALLRLTRPPGRVVRGRVMLNGRDVMALSEREFNQIRLGEIALVPQGAMNALNPVMRVRDQIEDGIVAHEEV